MTKRLPKSYVLPSCGLLMASVPLADPEIHDILIKNALPSGNKSLYKKTLLEHYASCSSTTYIHEWGHILQNVTYPYLFLRALRELGFIDSILSEFQADFRPTIPTNYSLSQEAFESTMMDTILFRVQIDNEGKVKIDPPSNGQEKETIFAKLTLLRRQIPYLSLKLGLVPMEMGTYITNG